MALALFFAAQILPVHAQEKAETGQVSAKINSNYARLIFSFSNRPKHSISSSSLQGGILVLKFERPVDINVNALVQNLPTYISNVRRDKDGKSLRFALDRQLRVNTAEVNNELYLDLLPEPWVGAMPALPQDVLDELMRQAQEEQRLKKEAEDRAKRAIYLGKVIVKTAEAPTFTRIEFLWPDKVPTSLKREGDELKLVFERLGDIQLAKIQSNLPRFISRISVAEVDARMVVTMKVDPMRDVRLFEEGNAIYLDIQGPQRGALEYSANGNVAQSSVPEMSAAGPTVTLYGKPAENEQSANAAAKIIPPGGEGFVMSSPDAGVAPTAAPVPPAKVIFDQQDALPATTPDVEPAKPAQDEKPIIQLEAASPDAKPATVPVVPVEPVQIAKAEPTLRMPAPAKDIEKTDQGKLVPDGAPVDGLGLRVTFPFTTETGATFFQRGNIVWLVFATDYPIDTKPINDLFERKLRRITATHNDKLAILRMEFAETYLISATSVDTSWLLTFGDRISNEFEPAELKAQIAPDGRYIVNAYMNRAVAIHKVKDPVVGDELTLVLALGPTIGMVKPQQYVDFSALSTMQGAALITHSDDVNVRLDDIGFVIERTGSMAVSVGKNQRQELSSAAVQTSFGFVDFEGWKLGTPEEFTALKDTLITRAASEEPKDRNATRLDLARFYISHNLGPEALGVLKLAAEQDPASERELSFRIIRGVANYMSGRTEAALRDLGDPLLDENADVAIWRGLSHARADDWKLARRYLEKAQLVAANYPRPLQGEIITKLAKATIQLQDLVNTDALLDEASHLVVDEKANSEITLLRGRFNESVGRFDTAIDYYRQVDPDKFPQVGTEAVLRMLTLQERLGQITRDQAISRLETLSFAWRGDDLELEIYKQLGAYYSKENQYRPAFTAMRNATLANPDSEISRKLYDDMRVVFVSYFLDGKSDSAKALDVLSLFYDFRELTPAGRVGDDIIRRLSERLVEVDLLDQAIELLSHQVDNRLTGITKIEVATELALIYLMNHQPQKALSSLHRTRQTSMPSMLEKTRTLIEARALAGTGRPELATELLTGEGFEVARLRADILWEAKRWDLSSSAFEKVLGERWRSNEVLNDHERADIMRGAISYALSEDVEGLKAFRIKYAKLMAGTPDSYLFDVATGPIESQGSEFRALARNLAATDNLSTFWDIYRGLTGKTKKIEPITKITPLDKKQPA